MASTVSSSTSTLAKSIRMLFEPYKIREITLRNRIVVSPMCQYSSEDGFASDWHLVHLGSRAVGGAGLVFTEASAIEARGRISPQDLGIYKDEHVEMLSRITRFLKSQGAVAGTQIAHAGRKASTRRPWEQPAGTVTPEEGGWIPVGPTTVPFAPNYPTPTALSENEIRELLQSYVAATKRALAAGFEVIELHFAHGYLAHEFYSPLSNTRTDRYGGSFEGRIRLPLEIAEAVRAAWPERLPLFARISSTDWVEGGWDVSDSVELSKRLHERGVDLIDCSSGGNVADAKIPMAPLYQVPFAERIRREAKVPTGAVGLITTPEEGERILSRGQADLVIMAREFLRDPYFPLYAASELDVDVAWPKQYERARIARAAKRISA
jgi:2,4-dienoyl-CoA reductase-like NADH-dependent reductase (Old Yellow Enzyme family)